MCGMNCLHTDVLNSTLLIQGLIWHELPAHGRTPACFEKCN